MIDGLRRFDPRPVLVATAATLTTAGTLATIGTEGPLGTIAAAVWWKPLVAGTVGLAAIGARHGSVARPLGYAFAVGVGIGVHLGGLGLNNGVPGLSFRLGWAIFVGLVLAATVGSAGLLLGRGVRGITADG